MCEFDSRRLRASQDSPVPSAVTFWVPYCGVDKKERLPGEGTPHTSRWVLNLKMSY